jgi:hypothetical protein
VIEAEEPGFDPERIFATLTRHRVDYTVIGGFAVIYHGNPRATFDVDVVAAQDRGNLERLAAALGELDAKLRGIDAEFLPVSPTDPDDLGNGANWTLVTVAGRLDYLSDVPGAAAYDDLRAQSLTTEVAGVEIRVLGLDHLLRMKRAAGRAKDLADIEALTRPRRPDGDDLR